MILASSMAKQAQFNPMDTLLKVVIIYTGELLNGVVAGHATSSDNTISR